MLKKIVIGAIVLVLIVLGLAATQADHYQVQRSVSIKAAPEKIQPLISDFHQWGAWSPWEKLDPAMQRTFSGADKDKGAVYAWDGNDKVGAGRMEVLDVAAPSKVDIQLDFLRPFESHCRTAFTLTPAGGMTTVTWTMSGPSSFMTKLMGLVVSMDKMVGKDFESGLANLKAVAEK